MNSRRVHTATASASSTSSRRCSAGLGPSQSPKSYPWFLSQSSAAAASWHDRKLLLLFPKDNLDVASTSIPVPGTSRPCRASCSFGMLWSPHWALRLWELQPEWQYSTFPRGACTTYLRNVSRLSFSGEAAAGPQMKKEDQRTSRPLSVWRLTLPAYQVSLDDQLQGLLFCLARSHKSTPTISEESHRNLNRLYNISSEMLKLGSRRHRAQATLAAVSPQRYRKLPRPYGPGHEPRL